MKKIVHKVGHMSADRVDTIRRVWAVIIRDAPIIGIGRLLCQYRPIVIYYVL